MKKHSIGFTVEPEQYENIKEYAKLTWHGTTANLARFALGKYMTRYPIKRKGLQAQANKSNKRGDRE